MNILQMFDIESKLASVQRYSQIRLNNPESVLEHTGCVTLTCYIFGIILESEGYALDFSTLLRKAIAHDIDEIVTGDIPRPTKYFSEAVRSMFKAIEESGMNKVCTDLEIGVDAEASLYMDWHTAKNDTEGLIVSIADILSVVYKVWEEYMMYGNKTIARSLQYGFPMLREKLIEFKTLFPESSLIAVIQEAVGICNKVKE